MKRLTISALTALGLSAAAVHAAPFTVEYQDPNDVFGSQDLFSRVTIDSPVYDGTFRAGQFMLTSNDLGDFLAFCIEVTQAIGNGNLYEDTPNLFAPAVFANIDRLFSSAYDLVTDGVTAAGFQVALWEIVEDTATGIDLGSGAFTAVDATGAAGVVSTAQGFLDGLATATTGLFDITLLASAASQDVVTATRVVTPPISAVPVPASGLLLLSAGGLLMARRRKTAA